MSRINLNKMERKKILDRNIDYSSTTHLEGYDSNIDPKDLSKLFTMLQNPYKNNIGSIVRELTSNCFDSHSQAGVDDAVVVQIDKDDSGFFISFNDVGVGLSPEKVKNIYINYLASDKENNLDVIGAFGIGSKSPLSYQSAFFIDTVYEGVNYHYIMREGEIKPRIEKISETPIDQRNGTKIKLYIKKGNPSYENNYLGDLGIFVKECKKQLFYLDNVYFDISELVKNTVKINSLENDFKIYEGKHFLCRESDNYPFNGLHLSIGKIPYPIDWDQLGIDKIDIPFALKFDIAEVPVIQTREDVRYTDEAIKTIKNKIDLLRDEIAEMYNSQDFIVSNNHIEFYENAQKAGKLYIGNSYFNITSLYYHTDVEEYFITYKLMNHNFPTDKQIKPIHIKGLGGSGVRIQDSWNFEINGYDLYRKINSNTGNIVQFGKNESINNKIKRLFDTNKPVPIYYINEGDRLSVKVNKYLNSLYPNSDITILSKGKKTLALYRSILNLYNFPKDQWREKIKLYQEHVEKPYESLFIDYNSISVTDEWWKEYKKNNYKGTERSTNFMYMSLLDINSDIIKQTHRYSSLYFEGYRDNRIHNFSRDSEDQSKAPSLFPYLVYGEHEDKTIINIVRDVLLNKYKPGAIDEYHYITVANSRLKLFDGVKNNIKIHDYIKMNKKEIENILYIDTLLKNKNIASLNNINYTDIALASIFLPKECKEVSSLKQQLSDLNKVRDVSSKIYNQLIDSCNYIQNYMQKTDSSFKFEVKSNNTEIDKFEKDISNVESVINRIQIINSLLNSNLKSENTLDLHVSAINNLNLISNKSILTSMLSINGITEEDIKDFSDIIMEHIEENYSLLSTSDIKRLRGDFGHLSIRSIVGAYKNAIINETVKL